MARAIRRTRIKKLKRLPFLKNRMAIRRIPMGILGKKASLKGLKMMGQPLTRTSLKKTSLREVAPELSSVVDVLQNFFEPFLDAPQDLLEIVDFRA